jgi:hypothetical protein
VEAAISKLLSTCRMSEKKGASTSPGALTKLCTAVNKFKGDGFKTAVSNNPASLVNSMPQRFCTAGFHAEGLPQGILLASLITLHNKGEIASKVGTSVKVGTEARECGAGVKKGSNGSRGLGGRYECGVSEKEETEEGHEEEEEKERGIEEEHEEEHEEEERQSEEEETEEEEHAEGRMHEEHEEEQEDEERQEEEEKETEEEEYEGRAKDKKGSGPCMVVELSAALCARIPGGALLTMLLLSDGAETGGIGLDIPGGAERV